MRAAGDRATPQARQGLQDRAMNFILVRLLQLDILDIQCAS